jgi:integrase
MIRRLNDKILFDGQSKSFGSLKVEAIDRMFCKKFYEKLLPKGNKTAEDLTKVLRNLLNTALDYGYIKGENPCSNLVIEKNTPREEVWLQEEFEQFCNTAQKQKLNGLYIAMNLAMFTAQRQTDILNLKWSDIDANFEVLYITQSKTKAKIELPLNKIPALQKLLKSIERKSEYVVIDEFDNKPYNHRLRLFGERFEKVMKLIDIRQNLLFRDLRRTSILKLDEAGCTSAEIASISGHSRKTILDMLEIYAPKSRQKASDALGKLDKKSEDLRVIRK